MLLTAAVGTAAGCRKSEPAATPASAPAPAPAPAPTATSVQPRVEVAVTDEGFVPSQIPAQVGKPLTLAITRKTEKTCATEVLIKGEPGKTELPLGKTVEVTFTPKTSGDVKFGCAMGMMTGGVIAVQP